MRSIGEFRGTTVFGPLSKSQLWQPIDVGHIGIVLKALAREKFDIWIETVRNGTPNYKLLTMNASEKRVMLTHILGRAYECFCSEDYETLIERAFLKSVMLLTLDGTNDDAIAVEGHNSALALKAPNTPFTLQSYIDCFFLALAVFVSRIQTTHVRTPM